MNGLRRHPLLMLLLALALLLGGLAIFRLTGGAKPDSRKNRLITVGTTAPIRQDLNVRLAFTADIQPDQMVNLFSRVDGYIAKFHVDKGDFV
ncbi:MAG: efflux RND transporter periplasmic adaptor subunit, partial [Alphaproteobacteria bacterium]|nr:efflux RND transporter periplasmic adaptor subunit [Alphaproteobacteria bacterium]